jgi:two-component system, sporulation sensor kinase E
VSGKKKDGSLNRIEFYGSRVIINGEPSIIGSMLDVTERRKAEEILKRSEANLKTIMDTTDTAYALFDKGLNVMVFNQMAVRFMNSQYNYTPMKGDKLVDYFPKERFPQFKDYAAEVLKGKNISYEINYPQPDGSNCWFYVRLFPITNDKKEIFGLMLALSDISERKNAEENLKAAYELVQEHINSIKDMAWKQSHLIRSPVANLIGLVALLKEDPTNSELMNFISNELERLDSVIIDLAGDASNHD